ncbi:MAG TPA: hypothetical protein VNZ47_04545, partial [Candidatus Dormibacteraeota bacterium]|nr:hypothetical protein [Candidatus Dormibacteraeota bacterium]
SRTKQLMTARHSHLLLFILISPWKLVVVALFLRVLSKMHLLKKTLPYFTKQHGYNQTHQPRCPHQAEALVEKYEIR